METKHTNEPAIDIDVFTVDHLPIVKAITDRMDLVSTIDGLVPSEMHVSPGTYVLAMVMDTLSGRSPLYHLESFFECQDTELLLGKKIAPKSFNDDNIGRSLEKLFDAGTNELFTAITLSAFKAFPIEIDSARHDTTSVNVYGEYLGSESEHSPFWITNGYSKDHRPDLKQFVFSLLCVGGNVPVFGKIEDGNASDKKINGSVLGHVSEHLTKFGANKKTYVYVADSALVTEENLEHMGDDIYFVSRLPANYSEHDRVVREAVDRDEWKNVGRVAEAKPTANRPVAEYRIHETATTLHGREYRALVVHSSGHDKRRRKRLAKEIETSRKKADALKKEVGKSRYFCLADAEAAARRFETGFDGKYHECRASVVKKPKYTRGRKPKNGERRIVAFEYELVLEWKNNAKAISRKEEELGCFVLISNVPVEGKFHLDSKGLLTTYKEQHGIERNFGFLKDDAIINAIFLEKPSRIEALGLIMLISLLVWRLIEWKMRDTLKTRNETIKGWDDKPTKKPTGYMLLRKFKGVMLVAIDGKRRPSKRLSDSQREFLTVLELTESVFAEILAG